jgi:hypothetical protein
LKLADHGVIGGVVCDEWNLIVECAGGDAGICCLNGRPFRRASNVTSSHLAQFTACVQNDVLRQVLRQFRFSDVPPTSLTLPPLQLCEGS